MYGRVFYFWGWMSTYKKPYLTFQEQLALLKSRGLLVTNDEAALSCLQRIGYYRLSAYWYPLRKTTLLQEHSTRRLTVQRQDDFRPGCSFQQAIELYVFDKRLRLLVLDAIERIEVAIRVDIAYLLGQRDPFAYTNGALLHGNFAKKQNPKTGKTWHQDWLDKYEQALARSKEDFVRHIKLKYGLPLPIWVAVELWEFGMLSIFFQGMTVPDKREIAAKYGISDWQIMESWLRALNFVRNVAAHHSRLWNKNLIDQPKLPKRGDIPQFDPLIGKQDIASRLYVMLCIMSFFMRRICPNSSWPQRVSQLLKQFPEIPSSNVADIGAPSDWETHGFWPRT